MIAYKGLHYVASDTDGLRFSDASWKGETRVKNRFVFAFYFVLFILHMHIFFGESGALVSAWLLDQLKFDENNTYIVFVIYKFKSTEQSNEQLNVT